MKKLVEVIAKALVDEPDQVRVTVREGEKITLIEFQVAPGDVGKVIGKQGRTAAPIRLLLGAVATKLRKRAILDIPK